LPRLERLDLAFNRSRGLRASIANLTALTSLDLARNGIGDVGAQTLEGLVNLRRLDFSYNNIGDAGAQALKDPVSTTSVVLTHVGSVESNKASKPRASRPPTTVQNTEAKRPNASSISFTFAHYGRPGIGR
jgi:Leucine-rich repeat (LRR) protein